MKVVVVDGPRGASEVAFNRDSVLVGRERERTGVDLDLSHDEAVSRKHARLFVRDGIRWIEDLGSRNGTWLNGARLDERSPRPIGLGDIARIGDTTFVVGTDRLLHLSSGKLSILLDSLPLYGYGLMHSGIPLIRGIIVWNRSTTDRVSTRLSVQVAGHGNVLEFEVGDLAPGERRHLAGPEGLLQTRTLEGIAGLTASSLDVMLDGAKVATQDVGLISSWEWPHSTESWGVIAAYVQPDDASIRRLLHRASERLRRAEGTDVYALVEQDADGVADKVLRAVYECLSDDYQIRYRGPHIQQDPRSGLTYQSVRPPEQVLHGLVDVIGEADCMDLSLVFAACLESIGLTPMVLLCGDRSGAPEHALVGCWTDATMRFRPFLAQDFLLSAHDRHEIDLLEATGVCRGRHGLTFEGARGSAEQSLRDAAFVQAIDISCLRPPLGQVVPMRQSLEPVVSRAFWEGERFRNRKGIPRSETSHILYGILAAEGALVSGILAACGIQIGEAIATLDQEIPEEEHGVGQQETTNYKRCEEEAKRNAKTSGVSRVRESDLLWALLDSPSTELDHLLDEIGATREQLQTRLEEIVPRPVVPTVPQRSRKE